MYRKSQAGCGRRASSIRELVAHTAASGWFHYGDIVCCHSVPLAITTLFSNTSLQLNVQSLRQ